MKAVSIILLSLYLASLSALGGSDPSRIQVTIGSGDELYTLPIALNYSNGLFETLYYESEISTVGQITTLSFYNSFINSVPPESLRVWMGTTNLPDLAQDWIPSTDLTLVFEGLLSYPQGENTITLGLNAPFSYGGGTLAMLVQRPFDPDVYHNYSYFKCQTVGANRSRAVVNNSTVFDPAAPPAPNFPQLSGKFPKTTLHFADGPGPEALIQPAAHDFGQAQLNSINNQPIQVFNVGLSPLVISNIGVSGSPCFSLLSVPALPLTLAPGQSSGFIVHYVPDGVGLHNALITITDNSSVQTIPLSGTGVDPTIYTLPYSQNFDAAVPPALPLDWSAYLEPVGSLPFIRTFADDGAPSQPNLVRMMNSSSPQGYLILIAPPLDASIPVSSTQLTFSAQAFGTLQDSGLAVGVISDPGDPFSFSEVQFIDIETSDWADYTVQFFSYQGTGRQIAIKHAQLSGYNSIKLDDILISSLALDDLAATSLTGTRFPNVGTASGYQITVANHGTGLQDTYLVSLMMDYGIELGLAAGPPLAPGESAQVTIPWTPSIEGIRYLYGEVVLDGEIVIANNVTPLFQVNVLGAGIAVITIGAGDQLARIPVDLYRKNGLFETVYRSSEFNQSGMITGLQFYNNFLTSTPLNKHIRIWLGETALTDLSAGWIGSNDLQPVFDGPVHFRPGNDIVPVSFAQPYAYQGGNLVMLVNRFWDDQIYNSSDNFLCQSFGSARSRYVASDTVIYHPENPPVATLGQLMGLFPLTSFFILPDTGAGDHVLPLSGSVRVSPNPFHDRCLVRYTLKEPSSVRIGIYNLRGQLVRTLDQAQKPAGEFSCGWDGSDDSGQRIASGIYLCQVKTGKQQILKRLVYLH